MNEELKQNTIIFYNINNTLQGYGKIVGQSTIHQPIIGAQYIIEPDIPITNQVYPYSHFAIYETNFKVVPIKEIRKLKLNKILKNI